MGSAGSNESALSFYLRAPRVGAVPRVCPNSCLCCPCCFQIIRIKKTNTTGNYFSPFRSFFFPSFVHFLEK